MNTPTPQQLIAAQQASVASFFGLANQVFAGVEKLVALNLQAGKASLAESQALFAKALEAKHPGELFALSASLAQPASQKAAAYGREVGEILSGAQAELSSTAAAQFQQAQKEAHSLIESLAQNTPAGSEAAIAAWKSTISASQAAYASATKAAKQFSTLATPRV
jgi:phasin family protein